MAASTTRVHSVVTIKAVDDEAREFVGIASTPATDRMDDIVEPSGAEYKLPLALLWQHDRMLPVGTILTAKATKAGIEVRGSIPKVDAPQGLAARLEEAWQSLKHQLVRGLSIGFRPLEYSFMDNGGIHFTKWEWLELSLVTIPANAEATITSIKSFDREQLAASGKRLPTVVRIGKPAGASASTTKTFKVPKPQEGNQMNIEEQIKGYKEAREAKAAEMVAIMEKSAEAGETLDAEQEEQYDTLQDEVTAIDKHLDRLEKMAKTNLVKAAPVQDRTGMQEAARAKAPAVVKSVKNDEPGLAFARFALSMFAAKGDVGSAKAFAENKFGSDIRLQNVMKAAVNAGTTTSPTWAGDLVDYQNISGEFIEYLRPRTIVGQFGMGGIPSLRRVPFNSRIPGKTGAGTAGWTGEGYRKPVTSASYAATTLKWAKIAAISVVTEELERFSDPAIVQLTRDDLADAVIERMDIDFVDPDKAVGTGASESPASVTNGVTPIPSSGTDADSIRADIAALWATADATNLPTGTAVYITDAKTARALSLLRNPLGAREFPGVRLNGAGEIDGVPVIVSNYVPQDTNGSMFILAFASEIYIADDGQVNIDISREATIFMDDAAATATPTAAQLVSMFQTNQLAIRAERYVRWQKRRPQAVAYLSGVNWGA
ncbi:MAG: phage major capsid protein [Pseudomonadales bacterium]|nr:phage major capsid protein [Pseudomonadales bacterium]